MLVDCNHICIISLQGFQMMSYSKTSLMANDGLLYHMRNLLEASIAHNDYLLKFDRI